MRQHYNRPPDEKFNVILMLGTIAFLAAVLWCIV